VSPITESTQRWKVIGICASAIIALAFPSYLIREKTSQPVVEENDHLSVSFVGSEACRDCHRNEFDKWKGSHHQLAMTMASDETVLGDFTGSVFYHLGITSRFYKKDGKFKVLTQGQNGEMKEYEITHTFGWYPLQQYLIPFPGGRLQCLPIAWDSREKHWFHLYPDHQLSTDDWLYWTNNGQNWNGMCAECHSTDLRKNYDVKTDSYETTWSEISVGCEACHGPGSGHVAWAKLPEMGRPNVDNAALPVKTSGLTSARQIQICAPCHARRMSLDDNIHAHADFLDYGIPQLLSEGMYFSDGQILDEVYVYGSFVQSKMHAREVRCSDCHDVHSIKRTKKGNDLCLQCHRAALYDTSDHHFHKKPGERGKPIRADDGTVLFEVGTGASCEACHMPGRTYMGVDYRPDHSFRIPQPELTQAIETPNACNRCHIDQTAQWSLDAMTKWYGKKKRPHYGTLLDAGRKRKPEALDSLIRLAKDRLYPDIVRATALSLIAGYSQQRVGNSLQQALSDESAIVRHTAVNVLEIQDLKQRVRLLGPSLYDPVLAVRIEAARNLLPSMEAGFGKELRLSYEEAMVDYIEAMERTGDFASSRHNLANLYAEMGQMGQAVDQYSKAIAIDTLFYPAKVNLAMIYNQQGKKREAETLLRQVVKEHPDLHEIKYSLGLLLVERKAFEEAVVYLGDAAAALPQRARIHYNLSLLLKQLNRSKASEKALHRALSVEPSNPEYLYALSVFYLETSRLEEALNAAEKLHEADPENAMGRDLAAYIKKLISDR
jgi:tetratricopeptide (TPR) repeat protein